MIKIFLIYFLTIILLTGCNAIGYYSQSIGGQVNVLLKREDIHNVIDNQSTDDIVKSSLQQIIEIRRFASDSLSLPDNQSYKYYVDLKRPYVVWNVFAAPEFSLAPKKWCYPIIGCVSYRGYFSQTDAEEHAEQLKTDNLDVLVSGIAAYSTLGWFDDPVLNTMLGWRDFAIANLIFHELSHQIIYISNETSINEAFSTAVGRLGTIQWLMTVAPDRLPTYIAYLDAQHDFRQLLADTKSTLSNLYQDKIPERDKRIEKQKIFNKLKTDYAALKANWPSGIHFDGWFSKPINNARFTSTLTYLEKLPAFYKIFHENQGNWQAFYNQVIDMDDLSKSERDELLDDKSKQPVSLDSLIELIKTNLENFENQEAKFNQQLII